MRENVSVDFLRGIVMRAPNAIKTKDFYVESWGLRVLKESDDEVLFRGTGPEQYIYGLRQADTYGIDYVNFGMSNPERVDRLHRQLAAGGARLPMRGGGSNSRLSTQTLTSPAGRTAW